MIVVLFAWVEGKKRAPEIKGERTTCNDCGGQLTAVLPLQNVPHWRHLAGECDPWSEPEGPWHLWWKSQFDISECEIGLLDDVTGERHRADVLVTGATQTTVLELQHSSISDEERAARELFYARGRRMFWLLDMHDEKSFRAYNFGFCFRTNPPSAMVDQVRHLAVERPRLAIHRKMETLKRPCLPSLQSNNLLSRNSLGVRRPGEVVGSEAIRFECDFGETVC